MAETVRVWPGLPYPLGATWDGSGTNFALFSAHAEKVELCLFDDAGEREIARDRAARVHPRDLARLPARRAPGQLYGYRVYGPYDPKAGHRFNPNKLLLDPYAKRCTARCAGTMRCSATASATPRPTCRFDERDSAPFMPKCRVDRSGVHLGARSSGPAAVARDDHLRDARQAASRMRHPDVPEEARGTFGGLSSAPVVDYLREARRHRGRAAADARLRPRPASDRARAAATTGATTRIGFFAPHPEYLGRGGIGEFKTFVQVMHDAGIEVILDVVYNHTAEGNHMGPTLSFRGIDNRSYYCLDGRPALLQRLHRHRQRAGPAPPLRAAHGHRLACATGSRRCASTASASISRPRSRAVEGAFDEHASFLDAVAAGPGAALGQADRRALGHRPRRLSGRQFPAGLGRVERPVPRHRAQVLEGRRGPAAGARLAPVRLGRHLQPPRPAALGEHQLRHRPRRLHAARPGQLQRQAQRGQQGRQSGRHRQQQQLELRRRGADRRSRDPGAAPAADAQFPGHPAVVAGRADAGRRRRVRPHPGAATTTPTARTTRSAGSTGT